MLFKSTLNLARQNSCEKALYICEIRTLYSLLMQQTLAEYYVTYGHAFRMVAW